jgi:hypothetical protein
LIRSGSISLIACLICLTTSYYTHVYAQEQLQPTIQNNNPNNVPFSSSGNTTRGGTNDSLTSTNPVTIGALTAMAMNKVVLNVTQNVLNETSRILELKEFVLRVSAQESDNALLNLSFSALDSETSAKLTGVSIDGWLANETGISTYFFTGLTDSTGRSTFILPTRADEVKNTTLTVEAFLRGYSSQKQSAAFTLSS